MNAVNKITGSTIIFASNFCCVLFSLRSVSVYSSDSDSSFQNAIRVYFSNANHWTQVLPTLLVFHPYKRIVKPSSAHSFSQPSHRTLRFSMLQRIFFLPLCLKALFLQSQPRIPFDWMISDSVCELTGRSTPQRFFKKIRIRGSGTYNWCWNQTPMVVAFEDMRWFLLLYRLSFITLLVDSRRVFL